MIDRPDYLTDEEYEKWRRTAKKAPKARAKSKAAGNGEDIAAAQRPKLLVENCNPDRTIAALRDRLAASDGLYDRGVPVRVVFDKTKQGIVAQVMTPDAVVLAAHMISRPYIIKSKPDGTISEENARLPRSFAVMYLDWHGEWRLPLFNGVAAAPLLQTDGSIRSAEGYDPPSGFWCEKVPDLGGLVPERPTMDDAALALQLIRETFKTFCFADAEMKPYESYDAHGFGPLEKSEYAAKLQIVDISLPPGKDESAFLVGLLTAVCRPSLYLAPGLLMRAAAVSGAGAGKGLLARCICIIAFGRQPSAVTAGASAEELEKRIASELIGGSPALFLDNLNNTSFRSNLLASALTERPASVRLLGKSQMVPLNASSFVVLTGNALTVSEDLARRFIEVVFDAGIEDPEDRPFTTDIREEVMQRRQELLGAVLTIWRWGRQTAGIRPGRPLGSFETWCEWVRDPLLALGCQDPVERISEAKQRDSRRQIVAELFAKWWERHQDRPMAISDLDDDVKHVVDPQGRGRQYLVRLIGNLAGTRLAGLVLTRQAPAGHWNAATYALKNTTGDQTHRTHRTYRTEAQPCDQPMTPMSPTTPITPDNSGHAGPRCAQCNGVPDGKERLFDDGRGVPVLLHPECRQFHFRKSGRRE